MERLIPSPSAVQDLDVIVLGRAGMDLYPQPLGGKTQDADSFTSDLGGSAGNIAVALVRHGLRAGVIAPVSDDPVGRFVQGKLAHYGVEHLTPNPVVGGARTSLALAESRASDCEVVIYRNGAADFELSADNLDLATLDRAPVLIVTGTALAQEPSRSSTLLAMERAQHVVLDLDYRAYSWTSAADRSQAYERACELSDIIIGNDEEFDMLGETLGGDRAEQLAESCQMIVYKMGAKGSITYYADQRIETGIFPVEMLKPFGAGDAFMGGLVAGLAQQMSLADALRFGSAAAAMVVSTVGCASAMPTSDQVTDFINSRS